jgi:hypothetical protein
MCKNSISGTFQTIKFLRSSDEWQSFSKRDPYSTHETINSRMCRRSQEFSFHAMKADNQTLVVKVKAKADNRHRPLSLIILWLRSFQRHCFIDPLQHDLRLLAGFPCSSDQRCDSLWFVFVLPIEELWLQIQTDASMVWFLKFRPDLCLTNLVVC